jgi:hypothetical protein
MLGRRDQHLKADASSISRQISNDPGHLDQDHLRDRPSRLGSPGAACEAAGVERFIFASSCSSGAASRTSAHGVGPFNLRDAVRRSRSSGKGPIETGRCGQPDLLRNAVCGTRLACGSTWWSTNSSPSAIATGASVEATARRGDRWCTSRWWRAVLRRSRLSELVHSSVQRGQDARELPGKRRRGHGCGGSPRKPGHYAERRGPTHVATGSTSQGGGRLAG